MKALISILFFAGSVASADAVVSKANLTSQLVHKAMRATCSGRAEPCTTETYNCGGGTDVNVDVCSDGSIYLEGTNIPFTGCNLGGD